MTKEIVTGKRAKNVKCTGATALLLLANELGFALGSLILLFLHYGSEVEESAN